jgi:molecular chaperone HscB
MTLSLQSSDFDIFGLVPLFAIDRAALDARWKDLQREAHPDRFATAPAAAQREAMQWSVRINEAYQRLKDPLKRAAYLCELNGAPIRAEDNTAMPPAFLMQQMQWREDLDEAETAADLERMAAEVVAARREMLEALQQTADVQRDFAALAQQVRSLMFVERFASDVDARLDQLGQ